MIAAAAQEAEKAETFADRDITEEFVSDLLSDVAEARETLADAVQSTTARRVATETEAKAAKALLAGLQEVQKAAKQKYARTNRIVLNDYFVGKHLNGNRANLLQTSQSILNKLAEDSLPGFTTTKINKLKAARQAWIDANATQITHNTAARTKRAELREMLKSIEDRRIAIQLAADAEWPHANEANAGIRKEFSLSARRPLNG